MTIKLICNLCGDEMHRTFPDAFVAGVAFDANTGDVTTIGSQESIDYDDAHICLQCLKNLSKAELGPICDSLQHQPMRHEVDDQSLKSKLN